MGLSDLFKNIFGLSVAISADERALSGASEDALATSLEKLANRKRGWIPLAEAAALFSTEDRQYAFGEFDDDGKNRVHAGLSADGRSLVLPQGRLSYSPIAQLPELFLRADVAPRGCSRSRARGRCCRCCG